MVAEWAGLGRSNDPEGCMTPWQRNEPTLTEMLQEPIIRAMMLRDAVEQEDLLQLFARLRANFTAAALPRRAH